MAYSNMPRHDAEVRNLKAEAARTHAAWRLAPDESLTSTLRACTGAHMPEMTAEHLDALCPYRSPLALVDKQGLKHAGSFEGKVVVGAHGGEGPAAPAFPSAPEDGHRCPRCCGTTPFESTNVLRGGLISGKRGFTALRSCPTCGFMLTWGWRNF